MPEHEDDPLKEVLSKFAWDPKKHEAELAKQPQREVLKFQCPCGCDSFVPMHLLHLIKQGNEVGFQFSSPPNLRCAACGNNFNSQEIAAQVATGAIKRATGTPNPDSKVINEA